MDVDIPDLVKEIIEIIERHSRLSVYRLDNLRQITTIQTQYAALLQPLKKVLCFLDEKNLLDQPLFNFIIENKRYINQLSVFLNWFKELNFSSGEVLDFFKQLDDLNDIDRVIARLEELESRAIFDNRVDFTIFSGLVDLINEDLDEPKYIDLIREVENTPAILKALKILKRNNLLQDPYYEFVFDIENFFPISKAELISKLKKNNALSEQSFNLCKKTTVLSLLLEVANILERNAISLRDNFLPLAARNIYPLFSYLKYLEKNSLVIEEQITAIKQASDDTLKYLFHIFSSADELDLPIELSLFIVEKSERLRKLSKAFILLKNENYLTLENCKLLSTNRHYPDIVFQFSQALVVLRNNQLDDIRWKNEAHNSKHPLQLVFFLKELNKAGILSDTHLVLIKKVNTPHCFLRILKLLNRLHSLTEENFEKLIKLDKVLAFSDPLYEKLSRMKSISLELISDVFLISGQDLSKATKLEKIEQLLEREGEASLNKPRLSLNREQSTHVSSVQVSISQSAKRFLQKYGQKIAARNLDKNFLEITNELKGLASDNNVKNRSALNALEKIISQSDYIEPISKLNLKELLVLVWEGILDDSQRISSILDAKVQIIEGLYEIQRGNNIDAFGQDNGLPDDAICCTGAFNKLIEKMVGFHQFAEVISLTPELATIKFPLVVKEKGIDYLISLDQEQLLLTYDLLKEEGIAFIWKHIASNVQEAMLAEFSSLYQLESGEVTEDFKRLMASHEDLEIDEKLLASLKSAYALRKLELAASATPFSECGEVSGVEQRLKRSVNDCVKKNTAKKKRYRPFSVLHHEFEYSLVFFMGLVEPDLEKMVLEKIEILQKKIKDKYLSTHAFDDFAAANLEGICEIWLIAERFIKENTDIAESNLIEFSLGEKKYYISIKPNLQKVGSYRVYCSTINKEAVLEANSDDVEETIEAFKEILYPDDPLYQIKTRYLSYFQPEGYLSISAFQEMFLSPEETLKTELHDFEGVPRKGFYDFFLFNGRLPTDDDVNFLFDSGLALDRSKLSFALEKMPEILSYFSAQAQIALGKFLSKYHIPMEETQSVLMGGTLNQFHKDLLLLLIDYANNDEIISEEKLNELARETCYAMLIKTDLDSEEATRLLDDLVQSHNQVKFKLENVVGASRLSIILAPALIKALNGHSNDLIHVAGMMGGDHLINESYLNLIKHEGFIRRFPKLSNILQKGMHGLASPITKLLLLTSFYELTNQLLNTASDTPEYRMAQALLLDNTILFSALFAEAFGLELGPAGIILDLGITIHQLLIASNYIRQHYHLQISLWEGIKFELGFDGIVNEILESREIVRLSLESINHLSKYTHYYFGHVVLKGAKVIEIESKKVERKELPNSLLEKIYLSPLTEITSLRYLYRVDTRMGRVYSYTTVSYLKRQIIIKSSQEIFINFSEKNISLAQENNIFFKFEYKCDYVFRFNANAECFTNRFLSFLPRACLEKKCIRTDRILTEGWGVVSSTTMTDQGMGRIENRHPLTLQGNVGAMLENKNVFPRDSVWIKVLILFNPIFGNMTVEDGSFLKNQTLVVLIQDPPLADIIVNDRMQSVPVFNFTRFIYLNKLHYWVGFNSISSIIEDNFACLSIYLMPLSLDDPEQTITMLSTSQLIVGEKGPRFVDLEKKREIIIYCKRGYFLDGYFHFISPIIKLHTPTVKSKETALFGLGNSQICSLENIQGTYIFYSSDRIESYEIIIQVARRGVNTVVTKQLNNAYFIESKQLLNFLTFNYYSFIWPLYNITELNVSWCEIDCPLINVRSKVSEFLDLTFSGRFQLADKNYTASFFFRAEKIGCNFFDLNGDDLLLTNFVSFKELLKKGYSDFNFLKLGYLNDKLEYIAHEKKIIYKKIQYRLDEEYQLLAVTGQLMNRSIPTESFGNLLSNVGIDLRDSDPPVRLARNRLKVGERVLTQVATSVLLLTKIGKQYMGLLPIFAPDEEFVANLKVNVHEVNESESVSRLTKPSDCKPELPSLSYLIKAIGGVLGSTVTCAILTKYTISYRRRVNHPSESFVMGLMVTPLLSQTVQALKATIFSPSAENKFENKYQFLKTNSGQRFSQQGINEEKRDTYNESISSFFEHLPQQVLFLNWSIGWYKKLTGSPATFLKKNSEDLFVRLANEINKLYGREIDSHQKKKLSHFLASIHRLSFFIYSTWQPVFITREIEFFAWKSFILDLSTFEKQFAWELKKERSPLAQILEAIETISMGINKEFLNDGGYLAKLDACLQQLANAINLSPRHLLALELPDPQWVISYLHSLQDALFAFKQSSRLTIAELKYYIGEVFPHTVLIVNWLEKNSIIDLASYLNLCSVIEGDYAKDSLFNHWMRSTAANRSIKSQGSQFKGRFFTVNKMESKAVNGDYTSVCNKNLRGIC